MTRRDRILATLEGLSSLCLDTAEERERVADALVLALHTDPDAALIRREFEYAPTWGGKLTVARGIGGKREAALLEAAARLAGCP